MAKLCCGPAGTLPALGGLSTHVHHLPGPAPPPRAAPVSLAQGERQGSGDAQGMRGQHPARHQSSAAQLQGMSYHHWENNSGHGGLEDPEEGQAQQLDDSEEVYPAQGHVAEVGEVWLVLGWHQEQPHAVCEL